MESSSVMKTSQWIIAMSNTRTSSETVVIIPFLTEFVVIKSCDCFKKHSCFSPTILSNNHHTTRCWYSRQCFLLPLGNSINIHLNVLSRIWYWLCNVLPCRCQSVLSDSSPRGHQRGQWAVRGELYCRQSGGVEVTLQPLPAAGEPLPAGGEDGQHDQQTVPGLGHDPPLPGGGGSGQAGGGWPRRGVLAALLRVLQDSQRQLVQSQAGAGGVPPLRVSARGDSLPPDWRAVAVLPGRTLSPSLRPGCSAHWEVTGGRTLSNSHFTVS